MPPTEVRPSVMTEGWLVGAAASTWLAASAAPSTGLSTSTLLVGGLVGVLSISTRRKSGPWLVTVVLLAVGAARGVHVDAHYELSSPRSLDDTEAVLVVDTEPTRFGWQAEAKLSATGERVRLSGSGFERPDLIAGQPVVISGRLRPVEGTDWDRSRHLVGRVSVSSIEARGDLSLLRTPGEWLRRGVLGATNSFSPEGAALYHGLVIGDDRFQAEGQQARFRAAGLSHLLAVSGQNVAFLLAVFSPLLGRLGPASSLLATIALLVVFALATRLEPSVMRATVTAGVVALAFARSGRAAGLRALSIAVTALVLIDPFLTLSVAFQLSVGASAGILVLAPALRDRLPGPSWIADPAAITIAAQLGVSPILMATFGPVALVTVPANLLAGWAAGAVMTLGLSVGLVASVVPEPVAAVLQLPARLLVWWIDAVAGWAAVAPLPSVGPSSALWLLVAGAALWAVRAPRWLVAVATVAGVFWWPTPDVVVDGWIPSTSGSPSVLIVRDPVDVDLERLIEAKIGSVDLVVVADGGWFMARALDRLRDVVDVGEIWAPPDHRVVGARRVTHPTQIEIDQGQIVIVPGPSDLMISIEGAADIGSTRAVDGPQG